MEFVQVTKKWESDILSIKTKMGSNLLFIILMSIKQLKLFWFQLTTKQLHKLGTYLLRECPEFYSKKQGGETSKIVTIVKFSVTCGKISTLWHTTQGCILTCSNLNLPYLTLTCREPSQLDDKFKSYQLTRKLGWHCST